MKLIFLDVDGVLNRNSTREVAPSGCTFVEDVLVARLKRLYYHTHASIILSSTWRDGWYDLAEGREDSWLIADYEALAAKLLSAGIPISGYTPQLMVKNRAEEIRRYLAQTKDVEGYVILDDLRLEGLEAHHVRTKQRYGLTDEDVERAIEILRRGNP